MKDLTVIIPIMRLEGENLKKFVTTAFNSVNDGETNVIVVGTSDIIKEAKKIKTETPNKFTFLVDDGNYQSHINKAVEGITTKFFTVLDANFSISKNAFKNAEFYIANDTEGISVYLTLMEAMDVDGNTVAYLNEANWATSFSEAIGQLDLNSTKDYSNYHMSGAIINTSDFKGVGGLKESMKEAYWYEFILRGLKQNKIFFVIPKIGAYAYSGDNPSWDGVKLSEDEANWWFDLARKEYIFPQDRNITYE